MAWARAGRDIHEVEVLRELKGRSLCKDTDVTAEEVLALLELSNDLRREKRVFREHHWLRDRNIALVFEKASTRTRSAFEVAAYDEGAHPTYMGPDETQLGHKESVRDTARVLGRMYDGIEFRGFEQESVEVLGEAAGVPVWNGLTDKWHPTQALADIMTIRDHSSRPLNALTVCYVGDAANNTAASLIVSAARLGMHVRVGAPEARWPSEEVLATARSLAAGAGGEVAVMEDPHEAAFGADFVYTDVWLSMGEPREKWAERIELLLPYRVDNDLMRATSNRNAKFMHCLPAIHNLDTRIGEQLHRDFGLYEAEVTDDVFESAASIVFDQAENRLHTIKALMVATIVGGECKGG